MKSDKVGVCADGVCAEELNASASSSVGDDIPLSGSGGEELADERFNCSIPSDGFCVSESAYRTSSIRDITVLARLSSTLE